MMKLTKEKCLEALRTIEEGLIIDYCQSINYVTYHGSVIQIDILKQLINEHFDSSLTREKLEKALDKALDSLVELDEVTVEAIGGYTWNRDEWKEYLINED